MARFAIQMSKCSLGNPGLCSHLSGTPIFCAICINSQVVSASMWHITMRPYFAFISSTYTAIYISLKEASPYGEDAIRTYGWQQPLFHPHHLLLGASRMRAYAATGPSSVTLLFFVRAMR